MAPSRWVRRQSWLLRSRALASTEHTVIAFLSSSMFVEGCVSKPGWNGSQQRGICSQVQHGLLFPALPPTAPCLPLSWHCWDGALRLAGSSAVPDAVFATWVHLQLHNDSAAFHHFMLHLNACTHRMALCVLCAVLPFPLRRIQVGPRRFDKAGPGDVSGALMEMISCHPRGGSNSVLLFQASYLYQAHTFERIYWLLLHLLLQYVSEQFGGVSL